MVYRLKITIVVIFILVGFVPAPTAFAQNGPKAGGPIAPTCTQEQLNAGLIAVKGQAFPNTNIIFYGLDMLGPTTVVYFWGNTSGIQGYNPVGSWLYVDGTPRAHVLHGCRKIVPDSRAIDVVVVAPPITRCDPRSIAKGEKIFTVEDTVAGFPIIVKQVTLENIKFIYTESGNLVTVGLGQNLFYMGEPVLQVIATCYEQNKFVGKVITSR